MTNWQIGHSGAASFQRKVDFSNYTEQYNNAELSVQEFAKIVAEKLKGLEKFKNASINNELDKIICDFEDLSYEEDDGFLQDDFDLLLGELYNWGDLPVDGRLSGNKVCWIQMR